ncbi:hypothetical protein PQX77_008983 [Marasmius sp. AFHP31]|nr:hypothetical protein PQX77_008983 [Marasmius sp. AFHP31]
MPPSPNKHSNEPVDEDGGKSNIVGIADTSIGPLDNGVQGSQGGSAADSEDRTAKAKKVWPNATLNKDEDTAGPESPVGPDEEQNNVNQTGNVFQDSTTQNRKPPQQPPQLLLQDMFSNEFLSSVTSQLEDFDSQLFRPDGDINFERDFGNWFDHPDDIDAFDVSEEVICLQLL